MRYAFTTALAGLLLLAAAARAEDPPAKPADVALPFNPAGDPAPGDWARYKLVDPSRPDDRLPPEIYAVRSVDAAAVTIVDGLERTHRYARGDAGKGALAFLRGFFGEVGASQLDALRTLAVTADPIVVGGKRYEDAVRIDATSVTNVADGGGAAAPKDGGDQGLRAEFRIWLSRGVKAGGVLRAIIDVHYAGQHHGGALELDGQGAQGESPMPPPPAPQGVTPTATPPAPGK